MPQTPEGALELPPDPEVDPPPLGDVLPEPEPDPPLDDVPEPPLPELELDPPLAAEVVVPPVLPPQATSTRVATRGKHHVTRIVLPTFSLSCPRRCVSCYSIRAGADYEPNATTGQWLYESSVRFSPRERRASTRGVAARLPA